MTNSQSSKRRSAPSIGRLLKGLRGIVCVGALALGWTGAAVAQDVTFRDFPYIIYCEYEGTHHAYYFTRVGPNGVAIYITPDRQAGTITVGGVARRVGGDRSGSCFEKSLEDLRKAGQAFDLPD